MTLMLEAGPGSGAANGWLPVAASVTHKRAAAEVLVDAVLPLTETTTAFSLLIPRGHASYRTVGAPDSLLVAEWVRQMTTATAHLRFDVPHGYAFVMRQLRVEVVAGDLPAAPEATVRVSAVDVRGGRLRSLDADIELHVGGQLVARGFGDLQVLEPSVYQRVRAGSVLSSDLAPVVAGAPALQVEGEGVGLWRLRYDPHDSFYFDHPLDHVPGMVFYEALRRIAGDSAGRPGADIISFDGTFSRYAELRDELRAEVRQAQTVDGRTTVDVDVVDGAGRLLVRARLAVSAS